MNDQYEEGILKQVDVLLDISPSAESTGRVMQRIESSLLQESQECLTVSRKGEWWRPAPRRVAYAAVAASVAVVATLLILNDGRGVTFAAVQEQLRRARTVTYTSIVSHDGERNATRWMISGSRTRREESNGDIRVVDREKGLSMHVQVSKNTVVISHDSHAPKKQRMESENLYERLRTLHHDSMKRIGERRVDGRTQIGFVIPEPGNGLDMTVWVDKRTQLPVRVEAAGDRVLEDFAFELPLNEELFDIEAPKDYRIEHRYNSPQQPVELAGKELASLIAVSNDRNRRARETAEAFLGLAIAGRDDYVSKLGVRAENASAVRELIGFQSLTIAGFYASHEAALAVTSEVDYRGQKHSLVIRMAHVNNQWSIDDIDLETETGRKEETSHFLDRHPQAKEVSATER